MSKYVEIPKTGIGDLSDGFHTFNQLYYQRMILFASLVKVYSDKSWKSFRHENGELCFGGGWFIVGIDTPEGSYTYHYENKYYDLFDCEELLVAKHWDGHDEKDVTRLLSLSLSDNFVHSVVIQPVIHAHWNFENIEIKGLEWITAFCSNCGDGVGDDTPYCPNCGARMDEVLE